MADSLYVVEVEVNGFEPVDGVDDRGKTLTPAKRNKANKAMLDRFDKAVHVHDTLVRDDGSGIIYFVWNPPAEDEGIKDSDGGAKTWQSASDYTEHIRSSVVGAQFQVVECRIGLRETD